MICTTLQHKTLAEIYALLPSLEMAEIRLDRCPLTEDEIEELFSEADLPLVATCRYEEIFRQIRDGQIPAEDGDPADQAASVCQRRLLRAIEAGAAYADVELEMLNRVSKWLKHSANENGTLFIRSWHQFEATPSTAELLSTVSKMKRFGGDVVKLVTYAQSPEDVARVRSLYALCDAPGTTLPGRNRLVAFCMGPAGRHSRLDCLREGAPFSYAALNEEEAAAPGQWPVAEMTRAVYGAAGIRFRQPAEPLPMPSSKSFAQRAILAAALAEGESVLRQYSPCGDNEAALSLAQALGASVTRDGTTLRIRGIGGPDGPRFSGSSLFVGESGLLARLTIPLMAAIGSGHVRIEGEKTLVQRPLRGARELMSSFGVVLRSDSEDCRVPLEVDGKLLPGTPEVSGRHGSQLISGLLAALPLLDRPSTLTVLQPKSIPYMFITLDVLKRFGIRIGSEMTGDEGFAETHDWGLCEEVCFHIRGRQRYHAASFSIEGDWSAAANLMVAAAVFGCVELTGLDSHSLQADLSILDILLQAGAHISQTEEEDGGRILVHKAPLGAFEADCNHCPDLFPIVSVLACFCSGTSRIAGVGRLAAKESDRAAAVVRMLTQFGVSCSIDGDVLSVVGESLAGRCLNGRLLRGGAQTSFHDHRMVMALKVASLGADGPVEIDDIDCVAKSYPSFLEVFDRL